MIDDLTPVIITLPEDRDVTIYPLSDLHYGSDGFRESEWKKFAEKIVSEPDSYLVIAGDMIDNAIKSSVGNVYSNKCSPGAQKEWLVEQLMPLKDKILCGCGGNHERRTQKECDYSPLYDVFARIGIEDRYRENAVFLFVRIGGNRNRRVTFRPVYSILVTHGNGGGSIGAAANKVEKYGAYIDGLDVIITGHTHKPVAFPGAKLRIIQNRLSVVEQQFFCVTACSWLKYGGYALQKMYPPTVSCIETQIVLSSHGKRIKVTQG